jgi:hypothetical protein
MNKEIKDLLQVIIFEAVRYNNFTSLSSKHNHDDEPLTPELREAINELVAFIKLNY